MATLSDKEVYALARTAGATSIEATELTAISWAESTHNTAPRPRSTNPAGGPNCGNWQIHAASWGASCDRIESDPGGAAQLAVNIIRSSGIGPWAVTHPSDSNYSKYRSKKAELVRKGWHRPDVTIGDLDEIVAGIVDNVPVVGPIVGGAINAVDSIDDVFAVMSDVAGAISKLGVLTKPETWLRAVEVSAGSLLLLIGLATLVFTPQGAEQQTKRAYRRAQGYRGRRAALRASKTAKSAPAPTKTLETLKKQAARTQRREAIIGDVDPWD